MYVFTLFCFILFPAREKPRDIILTGKKNDRGNSKKLHVGSEPQRTHAKCLSWQDPLDSSSPSPQSTGDHLTKAPEYSGVQLGLEL